MDDGNRSRAAFGEFLDYLAEKGLMPKATAQTRKASAMRVLSILTDAEAADVTTIDLDDLMRRFGHLHSKEYTQGSLASYASRLRAAMADFKAHLNNPLNFRPKSAQRARSRSDKAPAPVTETKPSAAPAPMIASHIMPIAVRPDLTVFVQGLPFDLKKSEAQKIANVILAMGAAED